MLSLLLSLFRRKAVVRTAVRTVITPSARSSFRADARSFL